jgi:serine/threonine protein phosphatase PrpC
MNSRPVFVSRENLPAPGAASVDPGNVVFYSHRAPYKETNNEDALAIFTPLPGTAVLAVADGLGGERAGSEAARLALESLRQTLSCVSDANRLREGFLKGIELANDAVRNLGIGAATTLAIAEIRDRQLRTYHVGDSAIIVCGQRGKDKFQSVPHSPTGYAVEAGLMNEADALQHEHRHLVSNVVGAEDMRIDIGPTLKLADRDTVLLASDGLTDNLYYEEIVDIIRHGQLEKVANELLQRCSGRMRSENTSKPAKPDDLSFILFRPGV